jgi:hypothetical protein
MKYYLENHKPFCTRTRRGECSRIGGMKLSKQSVEWVPQSIDSAIAYPRKRSGFTLEMKRTDRTPSMETAVPHAAKESPPGPDAKP